MHGDKAVWKLLERHADGRGRGADRGPVPIDVDTWADYEAARGSPPEAGRVSPDVLAERLAAVDYLADEGLATALYLAIALPQPLLLEGEAGVGKTEAAKALAAALDTPLIRVQCYEGIDSAEVALRVELPAPAAADPDGRGGVGRADGGRAVLRRLPACAVRCCARSSTPARGRPCC